MPDSSLKSILVTGASSGIVNAVTIYMAKQGYTGLAIVRKEADAEDLNKFSLILICFVMKVINRKT